MNDYQRIARIIQYLDQHHTDQPDLAELALRAGLSRYHFHRLFSRWAGITPKDFLQCLTLAHARKVLRDGESVLQTTLMTGLSGPARLHDLCVSLEAASPGEIKAEGAGWTITASWFDSPFGPCLVAESPRGICHLEFVSSKNRTAASQSIAANWPNARIEWIVERGAQLAAILFGSRQPQAARGTIRAFVRGSQFQVRVWRALLQIPPGQLVSYQQIAASLGNPSAARAVGSAVAANPLAYLIPCHRVIRETGVLGNYRWDSTRKKAIIAWESAVRLEPKSH